MRTRKIPNRFRFAVLVRGRMWDAFETRRDAMHAQSQFEQYYATGRTVGTSRVVPVRMTIEARL